MATSEPVPKEVLILGIKFAEYGSNLVTATHKLAELLASFEAVKVHVTSLTTNKDIQKDEIKLAEDLSKQLKVNHLITPYIFYRIGLSLILM